MRIPARRSGILAAHQRIDTLLAGEMIAFRNSRVNSALTTQRSNVAREMEIHNLYGLWQKVIKMNENTFPYSLLSLPTEDFLFIKAEAWKSIIFENPPILRKSAVKSGTNSR